MSTFCLSPSKAFEIIHVKLKFIMEGFRGLELLPEIQVVLSDYVPENINDDHRNRI